MSLFEKKLIDYLTVYKVPIGPKDLDPSLFQFDLNRKAPFLREPIVAQISKDLQAFAGEHPARIKRCYLVGNAVKPGYPDRSCPLKIFVILNKEIMDLDVDGLLAEEILKIARALSGRLAVGTTHPIEYYITTRDLEPSDYEGIYDVSNAYWVKIPNGLNHA